MNRESGFAVVPWHRGAHWWALAWRWMFAPGRRGPWLLYGAIGLVLILVADELPHSELIGSTVVMFFFVGASAIAAQKSGSGTRPSRTDLTEGLRPRLAPLLVGTVIVAAASGLGNWLLLDSGILGSLGSAAGAVGTGADPFELAASFGVGTLLLVLAGLVWLLMIWLAAWLAPLLIVLGGSDAMAALQRSLAAAWRNGKALTVYATLFTVFVMLAEVLSDLGWLVLAPLTALASYAAYEDLFGAGAPASDPRSSARASTGAR